MTAAPEVPAPPPDLRLVPPAVAAWVAALVALGCEPGTAAAVAVPMAVVGLALLWWVWAGARAGAGAGSRWVVVAMVLLCAAAAAGSASLRVVALGRGPVPELAERRAAVTTHLVVTTDARRIASDGATGWQDEGGTVMLRARVEQVTARGAVTRVRTPVLVLASGAAGERWMQLAPGHRVEVAGVLGPPRASGDVAAVLFAREAPVPLNRLDPVRAGAEVLRAGLRQAASGLPEEERGLLPGLVVGDTSRMPPGLEEEFRATGMTHLTAVSGANVMIVAGVVLYGGRWLGLGIRAGPAVAGLAMLGFLVLARAEPSVVRATAMGAIALAALASGRPRVGLPALCAATFTLVLVDPWLARSYGFALSVLATTGLVVLVPPLAGALVRWRVPLLHRSLPLPLAQALVVPVAAQLACGPVVAMLSGEVSLVAVPANLLAGPAVAPATVLGVLAAVSAPLSPTLAALLATGAGLPTWWVVTVAQTGASIPAGAVPWPDGRLGGLSLAAVLVAAWALSAVPSLRRALRRVGPRRGLALGAAAAVTVVGPAGLPLAPGSSWPPPGWVLVACDVGQGDALVLATGPGSAVVVDAGPDPVAVDGCLEDLGVGRVSVLILTHPHADHVDGVPGVLHGREVGAIEIGPADDPPAQAAQVREWAQLAGVPVRRARVGEQRAAGSLRWTTIWPARVIEAGSVPNNASIVVLAENDGVRLLLAGDVEPEAQAALLGRGALTPVDVLKVAHHGSAYQDPRLVPAVRPRVAVLSVGADNDYGHPAGSTLASLEAVGALVARTDSDGDVAVVGPPADLRVVRRAR